MLQQGRHKLLLALLTSRQEDCPPSPIARLEIQALVKENLNALVSVLVHPQVV